MEEDSTIVVRTLAGYDSRQLRTVAARTTHPGPPRPRGAGPARAPPVAAVVRAGGVPGVYSWLRRRHRPGVCDFESAWQLFLLARRPYCYIVLF